MFKWKYELRAGEDVLGTLRREDFWGHIALVETAVGNWMFKASGFFRPTVTAHVSGSESEVAVFSARNCWFFSLGEGVVRFANGNFYRWVAGNKWAFRNEAGEYLVQFEPAGAFLKETRVHIAPVGEGLPEVDLLVPFGLFLILLDRGPKIPVPVE